MSPNAKKLTIAVVVIAVIGFAYLAWPHGAVKRPSSVEPVAVIAPTATASASATVPEQPVDTPIEAVVGADGWQTLTSRRCGLSYRIPPGWSYGGMFGDGGQVELISTEAIRKSREFMKNHPGYVLEGDSGPSVPAPSLTIDCQPDIKSVLVSQPWPFQADDISRMTSLADVFTSKAFRAAGPQSTLVKTVSIDGQTAYEIRKTGISGQIQDSNYALYIEKGRIFVIQLIYTEYDKLPPTLKQILGSIKFDAVK